LDIKFLLNINATAVIENYVYNISACMFVAKQMEGMLDGLQGQEQKNLKIEIAGLKRDLIGKYRGEDARPDATPQKAPKH
jgi:hypothetical protein